jgi:eight-cysteine-cluster-containing protein
MSRRNIWIFLASLVFLLFCITLFLFFSTFKNRDNLEDINSFEECIEAGYPVMESYPEQCAVPGGQTFVKEVYYGESTNFPCEFDSDCIVTGCNNEICAGKDEETMVSICIYPEDPLPKDLGYMCACASEQCKWVLE